MSMNNKQQGLMGGPWCHCSSASHCSTVQQQMDYQFVFSLFYFLSWWTTAMLQPLELGVDADVKCDRFVQCHQLGRHNKFLQNGRSFVVAVLMQDTVIDLHYDSIFDACPSVAASPISAPMNWECILMRQRM
uniref:Uncharacterized protein n=1 Tax=Ditylenchus dipsaci TaxID=166011 RepID=A0A915EJK5_9BILA